MRILLRQGLCARRLPQPRTLREPGGARHSAVVPPSITSSLPVTYDDSSEAR